MVLYSVAVVYKEVNKNGDDKKHAYRKPITNLVMNFGSHNIKKLLKGLCQNGYIKQKTKNKYTQKSHTVKTPNLHIAFWNHFGLFFQAIKTR